MLAAAQHSGDAILWGLAVAASRLSRGCELFVFTRNVGVSSSSFSEPERAFCAHAFHLGLGSGKGAFCGLCPVFKTQRTSKPQAACEGLCGYRGEVGAVITPTTQM